MLDEAWVAIDVPSHPKGVKWGLGLCAFYWSSSRSLWTLLCAQGHSHAETGKRFP